MSAITVTVLTKDSQKYIQEVLDALKGFDEVLILDSGSRDNTLDIAEGYSNTRIEHTEFTGFGEVHNRAAALASNDWILSIDSDEVASPELLCEIQELELDRASVYTFPRKNYFNGRFIRHCGWYPDRVKRLYHRKYTSWTDSEVHETVKDAGMRLVHLKHAATHYSYADISHFLRKMQTYSDLFARQYKGKRSSSPCKAVLHGLWTFFKTYVIKRGFLDSWEGFVISVYNGHTAYYKYLKLFEANRTL